MTGPAINLRYYVKDRSKLGTHASVFPFAKLGLDKACPISCRSCSAVHCRDNYFSQRLAFGQQKSKVCVKRLCSILTQQSLFEQAFYTERRISCWHLQAQRKGIRCLAQVRSDPPLPSEKG